MRILAELICRRSPFHMTLYSNSMMLKRMWTRPWLSFKSTSTRPSCASCRSSLFRASVCRSAYVARSPLSIIFTTDSWSRHLFMPKLLRFFNLMRSLHLLSEMHLKSMFQEYRHLLWTESEDSLVYAVITLLRWWQRFFQEMLTMIPKAWLGRTPRLSRAASICR